MTKGHVAVIDIGKTNAKLALVDLETLSELAVVTRPNTVQPGPPYPHFDVEGHWRFILNGLAQFHSDHGVDAISITTHGAAAVLLDQAGALAAPVLDYEHTGPDELAAQYDAIRPPFSETGSPRLSMGLNLGAQLYWQFETDPTLKERVARIVTYPQYWAFRLTGVAATDVTSLGCHTDLWSPEAHTFSALVESLGITEKMATPRTPQDVLGPISPALSRQTGLAEDTPVSCGIHDSNASLLSHLIARKPPFSVVSTGTWVIAMAVGGVAKRLDPALDTLINVNAFGNPVPSARFMGGREHDLINGKTPPEATEADLHAVLSNRTMLMPAVVPETGPFAGAEARWHPHEPDTGTGQRSAALGFYLALVTTRCLELIGHTGPILVEGPFTRNAAYLRMLSVASQSCVLPMHSATGTSQGAALLVARDTATSQPDETRITAADDPLRAMMADYAKDWCAQAATQPWCHVNRT